MPAMIFPPVIIGCITWHQPMHELNNIKPHLESVIGACRTCMSYNEADKVLRDKGIESSIVTYPEANHNSWDSAFAEPDFVKWFIKH